MSAAKDDPRDASLEAPYAMPKTWYRDTSDGLGASGMFLSGLIMVTRNRYLAWPAVILGFNNWINAHPIRAKEGGSSGLSNVVSYNPMPGAFPLAEPAPVFRRSRGGNMMARHDAYEQRFFQGASHKFTVKNLKHGVCNIPGLA
ncbi:hypothetical protein CVT24_006149 [Panaeolus cyanescens]|uniref:Uncharacterized protein n=1 Tax=Panaeolus cyanescens TaxID=181874 RepID=A0A409VZW2_9AGAR|nr:hypothetical protein CVT24_006149 [Panaeolus cyanescens]